MANATVRARASLFALVGLLALAGGCASYEATPLHTRAPEAYGRHAQKDGVVVGGHTCNGDWSSQVLGVDVTDDFVLAVLSIRSSSDEAIRVRRADFALETADGQSKEAVPWRSVYANYKNDVTGDAMAFGALGAASASDANDDMRQDWRAKALADEFVLAPGEQRGGIVFFRRPDNSNRPWTIVGLLKKLDSEESIVLNLAL